MSSSSVQKSNRGSENKQGLFMSTVPSAKDEGSRQQQQIQSSTGNFNKRLETTIDTSADVRRTSEKRRKSSLVEASANAAQLNQTMIQIPSQEEER